VRVFSSFVNRSAKSASPILHDLEAASVQTRPELRAVPPGSSLVRVLADLIARPQKILFLWNWKSAWLSIILRGPIFLAASFPGGFRAAVLAMATECAFCAFGAGFYGALVQCVKDATPEWATAVFLGVLVPAAFQVVEYFLHAVSGTPHLRLAAIGSAIVAAISSLFNWYAMRRGALLVGGEGGSFGSDVKRLPKLLMNFIIFLPRRLAHRETGERR
jgi:hypothetical protein